MSTHSEFDQLSAFVDGELDGDESASVREHVASCTECRSTLDAIRATVADLSAVPEPEIDEVTLHRLRSAVKRERSLSARVRWSRWVLAAGAAASVAGLAVGIRSVGPRATGSDAASFEAAPTVPASLFTKQGAQAHLQALAKQLAPAPVPAAAQDSAFNGPLTSAPRKEAARTGAAQTCVAAIPTPGADEKATLVESSAGTFEGTRAIMLFFSVAPDDAGATPTRVELWVMSEQGCTPLFFAQAKIGS